MTVQTLKEMLSLTEFHLAEPEREVSGGYAGDLLSWVMGRAEAPLLFPDFPHGLQAGIFFYDFFAYTS